MSVKKGQKFNKVTPSHRLMKTIELVGKGKTLKAASKEAGYSCPQAASNAIRKARARIGETLERAGLTDAVLVKKYLLPLLDAKETLYFQHQGIVLDSRQVAALGIRQSALDMAFKLKGAYPRNVGDDGAGGGVGVAPIIINLGFLGPERAQAILSKQLGSGGVSGSDLVDEKSHQDPG